MLNFLNYVAPFRLAQDFDNVGLLVGDLNSKVKNCLVSLDVTRDVFKLAKEKYVDLIVSHHPIIFDGLKKILKEDLIYEVLQSKISIIAAHTNLDVADFGVSFWLAKTLELLDIKLLENTMGFGRIGCLKESLNSDEFVKYVSKKLKTPVRAVKSSKKIKNVAVVSGSGYFALKAAKESLADALVTGESKHDVLIKAFDENFCFVDASHFATENVFCSFLVDMLRKKFKDCGVNFFASNQENPCVYVFGDSVWG